MARVAKHTYTAPGPGGTRVRKQTRDWYIFWTDVTHRPRKRRIGRDRRAAESALARQLEREARARAGLPATPDEGGRPLTHLADEYLEVLAARGTSAGYRALVADYLARTCPACGWFTPADIRGDDLVRFLGRRRDAAGNSAATLNSYIRVAKGFARWVFDRLNAASPLRGVKPFPETDRRRSKRILTDAELLSLIDAADRCPPKGRAGFRGPDRAVLYRVAAYTGLRAAELATLTPESFDLLGSPPTVTVEAKDAKGRRREPVPLPAHLAGVLRPWLATKAPNAPVWPGRWAAQRKQVHWFARDLARAGVAVFDARGQRATFHGLRRSFVVRLIRAGGLIHEVRRMARHKDVATTLNYYTDTDLDSLGKLADKTPPLPD